MKYSIPLAQCFHLFTALLLIPSTHAIANGTRASNATHQYAVSVLAHPTPGEPYFTCAGSIVGLSTILTSASCVEGREKVSIRYGSHDRAKGGELADVEEIVMHPYYDNATTAWDFAVLRLVEGIDTEKGSGSKIVELPDEDSYAEGQSYRVAGWGKATAEAKAGGSTKLKEGAVQAVDREDCSKVWDREIGETQMCVQHTAPAKTKKATTSICDGDSGGPLVDEAGEVLHGVVSYGVSTCDTDVYPNVFSYVFAAREWILENLV